MRVLKVKIKNGIGWEEAEFDLDQLLDDGEVVGTTDLGWRAMAKVMQK